MYKSLLFFILIRLLCIHQNIATEYIAYKANTKPTIDGIANETCWDNAYWQPLNEVWLGHTPTQENCSAQYKACWNGNQIFLLMEVTDNFLVNWNPENPIKNYPSSDCPEIFLDEDNSGGDHETNYNAFAYHISTLYDIIDIDIDAQPKLFNHHIKVFRTNIGNTYTWEMAITVYKDNYIYEDSTTNETSSLFPSKVLGFTVAYNDSDQKVETRDAMISSVYIKPWACNLLGYTGAGVNCSWQNSSVFGTLRLEEASLNANKPKTDYPKLIDTGDSWMLSDQLLTLPCAVKITQADGKILKEFTIDRPEISKDNLTIQGLFFIHISDKKKHYSFRVIK